MVYHAKHLLMKKDVALKRLHPTLSAVGQIVQRFEREAQAAARIEHPNVCQVTDCGRDKLGSFYIVMELLKGLSLQEVLDAHGALPFERIIHLAVQICSALEQAHGFGIVHRDLKPDNIMLIEREGDEDFVKIMDFGIAKMVTDDTPGMNLTQAGMVFGTPHYLSPEQASGDPIDHRSDLYSLGVILFEMATGKRPFDAPSAAALIRKHVTEEPPLLTEATPGRTFSAGFQKVVSRLMAKNPADRYPSAKVVGDHLSGLGEFPGEIPDIPSMTSLAETAPAPVHIGPPPLHPPFHPDDEPSVEVRLDSTSVSDIEASAEQRLKQAWSGGGGARWAILGGSLLLAAAVVAAVVVIVLRPWEGAVEEEKDQSAEEALLLLEQERSVFNESPEIKAALTLSIEGEVGKAIELLEELDELEEDAELGGSPHLHYHLAVLYSNAEMLEEATASVGRCMEMEPAYTTEPILLGILVQALHQRETAKYASRVMIMHPSEELAHRIEVIAREQEDEKLRGKALDILRSGDMMRHLEKWSRLAAELADPDRSVACEKRRKLLLEIAETGEPRTLPTLALFKSTTGCDGKDCWECIRPEWQKAVDAVQGSASP
ncbi:MAG: serine/threonine protein kinase [Deltaproteobacteria bacterium]|nr:serine/threonine protein kinase [Deltaproteobacteria bacterium]